MKRELKLVAVATAAAVLAGCATGGGGGVDVTINGQPATLRQIVVCIYSIGLACPPSAHPTSTTQSSGSGSATSSTASTSSSSTTAADQSGASTLPSGITDPNNPDTWPSAGQATDYPLPFSSWDVAFDDVGDRVSGPLALEVVYQSADGERVSSASLTHARDSATLFYVSPGQLREFRHDIRSFVPLAALTERYSRPGFDMAWSTTNAQQTVFTPVKTDGVALIANPYQAGWNYQTFGVWAEPVTSGTEAVRGISFGAATPSSWIQIPSSGDATFTGKLAGIYISSIGKGGFATADLGVHVDFGTRTLSLASTGTMAHDGSAWTPSPGLDVHGTLSYSPGSGDFTGTLANAAGTMSGASLGRFYGPAAEELGGEFTLKSPTTTETFVGAYGAKR